MLRSFVVAEDEGKAEECQQDWRSCFGATIVLEKAVLMVLLKRVRDRLDGWREVVKGGNTT